jgi:DNA-binding beta-propeller fold protein YncE
MSLFPAARARAAFQVALSLPLLGSFAFAQSVIATIPATDGTLGNPMTIAINPLTGRVYIAGSNVEVVDQRSNQVIDTISVGSGQLQGIAVDPVLRRAYVIDNAQGLFAIDLNNDTVVGNYPYSNTNGVAVNPLTHRVYMQAPDATSGNAALLVFDGPTLKLITTVEDNSPAYQPYGGPQDVVVVNPVTNKIYVSVNLYPGAVWVVDGDTNTSETTIEGLAELAYGLDVDPFRNLIWVGGQLNQLSKVNGATNTLISTNSNTGTQPDGVSVDPIHQKVYVAIQQQNVVQIFDEKTNTPLPTTIPVGGAPDNMAIDYVHGLLYVGNTGETYQPNAPPPSVSVIKLQ